MICERCRCDMNINGARIFPPNSTQRCNPFSMISIFDVWGRGWHSQYYRFYHHLTRRVGRLYSILDNQGNLVYGNKTGMCRGWMVFRDKQSPRKWHYLAGSHNQVNHQAIESETEGRDGVFFSRGRTTPSRVHFVCKCQTKWWLRTLWLKVSRYERNKKACQEKGAVCISVPIVRSVFYAWR